MPEITYPYIRSPLGLLVILPHLFYIMLLLPLISMSGWLIPYPALHQSLLAVLGGAAAAGMMTGGLAFLVHPLWQGREITIRALTLFLLDVAELSVIFAGVTARFLLQSVPALIFALSYGVLLILFKFLLLAHTSLTARRRGMKILCTRLTPTGKLVKTLYLFTPVAEPSASPAGL